MDEGTSRGDRDGKPSVKWSWVRDHREAVVEKYEYYAGTVRYTMMLWADGDRILFRNGVQIETWMTVAKWFNLLDDPDVLTMMEVL